MRWLRSLISFSVGETFNYTHKCAELHFERYQRFVSGHYEGWLILHPCYGTTAADGGGWFLKPSGLQSFSSVVLFVETVQKRMDEWDLGGGGLVLSSLPLITASKERQTSVLDEGTWLESAIWSSDAIMTCIAPGAFLPCATFAISMLLPSFYVFTLHTHLCHLLARCVLACTAGRLRWIRICR